MANYNVDIAVAVKNTQAITQLSNNINQTGTRVDRLNEILEKFGDNIGGTVVNSVKNFSNATKEAAVNLNKTAVGSREATRAARDFVRAVDSENAALREQAALLAQVRNQGKSGTLRGGTQFSGPIGPGPASSTALSSPLPARSTRTTGYLSPIGPISPQQRTGRAEQIAREVALRSAANQKDFEARRTFQAKLFNIEKQFENSLEQQRREADSAEFDRLLKRLNAEQNKIKEIGNLRAKINQKEVEDFDKRFAQARNLRGQTSPIGGAVGIPGSPAAKAAKRGRGRGLSNLALGLGFPLLFGGGVGSVAGGALGSVGGMGGQVLGSAIGGQIDAFIGKVAELGAALNPATADVGALVETLGLVGSPTQDSISSLEELAGQQVALEAATRQLSVVVGDDGVLALEDFGDASTRFGNALTQVTTQVLAQIAKLTGGIVDEIAKTVEVAALLNAAKASDDSRQKALQEKLAGVQVKAGERGISLERAEIENQMVEVQRKIRAEEEGRLQAAVERTRAGSVEHTIAKNNLAIAQLDDDLANKRVFDLEKANIFQEARKKLIQEGADVKLIEIERDRQLLELTSRKNALMDSANDKTERTIKRQSDATDRLAKKQQRTIDRRVEAVERELKRTEELFNRESSQLDSLINKHKDKMAFEREYSRLIEQGSTPAAAEQAIQLQKQLLELDRNYDKLLEVVDAQILKTELSLQELKNTKGVTTEYEDQLKALDALKKRKEELEGKKGGAEGVISEALAPKSDREVLQEYLTKLQGQLNDLMNPASQLIGLAETVGGAFSESFKGIIDGSMTAQQALANLFQRTADHFLDMAAQMIAAQIKMQILNIGLSFFGGGNPGKALNLAGVSEYSNVNANTRVMGFADGGRPPVGRPSIVGERGPELFVPGASGTIIPNHAMGGVNVGTINITVENTGEQLNPAAQKQIAGQVQGIVLSTLANERRSGGML